MGRYVVDFSTSKGPEEVERTASSYLSAEGFVQGTYRDEQVWKKKRVWLTTDGPQYLVITPSQDSVHLEAWVTFLPGDRRDRNGRFLRPDSDEEAD
ncbi:MAG: hypothetical protein WA701_16535, partial [Solirubrobacterales bacterium]